ncbi:MAG: DUF3347 domain-containing protein, partial [Flavobacteriales bacterium]
KASTSSKVAINSLKKINEGGLDKMTKGHLNKIVEMFIKIANTNDIDVQREHFITLSENMISISSNLKEISNSLFVQNCPMANKNKGADWLSWEKEIRNPYYGEAMMTCGEVKQVISK